MRRISLSERAQCAWTTCLMTTLLAACAGPLEDPDLPELRAPSLGRLDAAKADGAVVGALACGQTVGVYLGPEPSFWKLDVPAGATLRVKIEARLSGRALKGGLFGEAGGAPHATTAPCGAGAWCLEGKAPPPTAFLGVVTAEPTEALVSVDCGDGEGVGREDPERPPLEPLPPARRRWTTRRCASSATGGRSAAT